MRYIIQALILAIVFSASQLMAGGPAMVWVEFTDKANSPYSLSMPHEFLSQRALERRQKQSIPIDFYDIPVSPAYLDSLLSDSTLTLYYTSRWFNGALFKAESITALERINTFDFVRFTEIARVFSEKSGNNSASQHQYEHDTYNSADSALMSTEGKFPFSGVFDITQHGGYGSAEGQISLVNGQSLHQRGFWGDGKVIAVMDAGFRGVDTLKAFDTMWTYGRILGYYDFVQSRRDLYQGHGHGTFVFSVMGGFLTGEFSGSATSASYWLIRTEDASSEFRIEEYNWLAGAEFADSVGADIINSSLGYTLFDDTLQNYSYAELNGSTTVVARAANMAFSRGMLVVNSAGNYGNQNWRYIGSPADAHGVLAVGGTDDQGTRIGFSSVGPSADGRVKPQVMAQGRNVWVANTMGTLSQANGTSYSAPMISGMAACLWEMFPDASNNQIKQAIIRSADRYLKPDSLYGFGIPDFEIALDILEKKLESSQFLKLANNPLLPESTISFYSYQQEMISIDMFNSGGQRVWSKPNISIFPGFNEIRPFSDISILPSGMYLIRVNFRNRTELLKAIKF